MAAAAAWTEADGAKIFEAALNAQLGDQNETCRAMRILGAHIHNVVVRKEALQCETPVHDIAGALERAVLSPDATGALLWGLATGWNDDPQKFIEDEGHNLDEAYQRRYLLATWVAKEVLLKAVNPNRAHALPAFLSGVLADNSARRSMMNLFVVLGLARSNKHEVRSERARVEIAVFAAGRDERRGGESPRRDVAAASWVPSPFHSPSSVGFRCEAKQEVQL